MGLINSFLDLIWVFIIRFSNIKGSVSVNSGGVKRPENPIPQIQDFYNVASMPGIGQGVDNLLFGVNVGLHYIID